MTLYSDLQQLADKARDVEAKLNRVSLCAGFVIDKFNNPDKCRRTMADQIKQLEEALRS